MDKITSKEPIEPIEKNLQLQDPELYKEEKVDSDLQSNRQLKESKEPTNNVLRQNFLQATEDHETYCSEEEEVKQDETVVNVKHEVENSAGKTLVPTQDLMQTIQLETDAVYQKYNERADDERLEIKRNTEMQQIIENPKEIFSIPAQNTISTAEYDLNDAVFQDLDRIDKNRKREENAEFQQRDLPRKLSILDTKKDLQQPCDILEENMEVDVKGEQGKIMQQESTTTGKLSESLEEGIETLYDKLKMRRKQELRLILDEFLVKMNLKGAEICNEENTNFFNHSKEIKHHKTKETATCGKIGDIGNDNQREHRTSSTQISEHDSNNATQQDWDKISENEKLGVNTEFRERSYLPGKLSIIHTKLRNLQQPCEISGINVDAREDIATQEENATPNNVSETPVEMEATQNQARDQDQVPVQQRIESSEGILTFQEQNFYLLSEHKSNDAAQEMNKISENEGLKTDMELQEKSDLPISVFDSNQDLQQLRKELEENVKVRNKLGIITQEESAKPFGNGKSKIQVYMMNTTVYDAEYQENITQEEKLRRIMAEFFEKNKNLQEMKVFNQNDRLGFSNSKEIEETVIHGKPKHDWNDNLQEHGDSCSTNRSESEYRAHARSQKQENDAIGCHQEAEDCIIKPKNPKHTKYYVTSRKRVWNEITDGTKKIKDYVTSYMEPLRTKGYVTYRHPKSANETVYSNNFKRTSLESQTKGYITSRDIRQNAMIPAQQQLMYTTEDGSIYKPESRISRLEARQVNERMHDSIRTRPYQTPVLENQSPFPATRDKEERCPQTLRETIEPGFQRNGRTLGLQLPFLRGTLDFIRKFRAQFFCVFLICVLIIVLVLVVYFAVHFATSKSKIGDSNVSSSLNESGQILNIPVSDLNQSLQSKSLDSIVNISVSHLNYSNDDVTTTAVRSIANTTHSLADLNPEIISMKNDLNDDANNPEINSESTVTTLMTDVVVRLINNIGITSNVNDFDINAITPMADLDINAIHSVPQSDTNAY